MSKLQENSWVCGQERALRGNSEMGPLGVV